MGDVYSGIWKLVEEICGTDLKEDMSMFEDLELDSVQIIELVLRIEEQYHFDFDRYDELMEHMDTVKDFVLYFETYIKGIGGGM